VERGPGRRPRQPPRRELGAAVAARGWRRPAAVRAAAASGALGHSLTERMVPGHARPPGSRLSGEHVDGLVEALASFPAGVTLVMVADGRDDIGTTVSAFCPVSVSPPLVLV